MSIGSNIKRGLTNQFSRASDYDEYFGSIYIISTKCACCQTRKTKIGKADAKNYKATRVKKRLKNYFATEYPDELNVVMTFFTENYNEAERQVHDHFETFRFRGEWFDFDTNVYYNSDDVIDPLYDQDYSEFVPNNVMQKIEEIINKVNLAAAVNQNNPNS